MNEYLVRYTLAGAEQELTVLAPSAQAAREQVEAETGGEVTALRLLRALGASCAIRDGRMRR